jgi:hypothetical protein
MLRWRCAIAPGSPPEAPELNDPVIASKEPADAARFVVSTTG